MTSLTDWYPMIIGSVGISALLLILARMSLTVSDRLLAQEREAKVQRRRRAGRMTRTKEEALRQAASERLTEIVRYRRFTAWAVIIVLAIIVVDLCLVTLVLSDVAWLGAVICAALLTVWAWAAWKIMRVAVNLERKEDVNADAR